MKNKIKKFETVFKSLIGVFIVCMTIVQSYAIYSVNYLIEKSNLEYLTSISNGIGYEINNKVEFLKKTARSISINSSIQTYLTATDEDIKVRNQRLIQENVFNINRNISKFLGCAAIDTVDRLTKLNNISDADTEIIIKMYPYYLKNMLQNGIFFDIAEGVLSIYKYEDVLKYDLLNAGRNKVGTVVMVDHINLLELAIKLNILDSIEANVTLKSDGNTVLPLFKQSEEYGNRLFGRSVDITDTQWMVNVNMYNRQISLEYITILGANIVFIAVAVFFIILLVVVFYRMYTRPMNQLIKYLNDYSLGGKNEVLSSVGVVEFNSVLKHINHMFDIIKDDAHRIVHTQEILYEKELEKQKIQLHMYQLQIQPHFLYNTLGCINYFAIEHNAPEIVEMISALTGILRYSTECSFESSVIGEITCTQSYVKIIQKRYPDKVDFSIDISDELFDLSIPSMSLQPIVENAVKHGILKAKGKRYIKIFGYVEDGWAAIEIKDNGSGMTEEQCAWLNAAINQDKLADENTGKIGLANVNKRMKLKFGDKCEMKVRSKLNEFTQVIIKIKL